MARELSVYVDLPGLGFSQNLSVSFDLSQNIYQSTLSRLESGDLGQISQNFLCISLRTPAQIDFIKYKLILLKYLTKE